MADLRDARGEVLPVPDLVWALGSLCALHRLPFSADLLVKQFPPPYRHDTLVQAARALGFKTKDKAVPAEQLHQHVFPCLVWLKGAASAIGDAGPSEQSPARVVLITKAEPGKVVYFAPGSQTPVMQSTAEFGAHYAGRLMLAAPKAKAITDPGAAAQAGRPFGFRWFVPELLKHKKVWRDVLLASLV